MNNASDLISRHLAITIFDAVYRKEKSLEDEFAYQIEKQNKRQPIEQRDRMFIRLMVTLMLRRLGQIDDILSRFLKNPLPAKMSYIQDILRLGVVQLVFLNTPAHAGVSTSVALVKKDKRFFGFSKLTNAVLRQVSDKGQSIVEKQTPESLNIPKWMFDLWQQEYGTDDAKKIALSALNEAPLDFSVKSSPELWAEKLEAVIMPTGTLRREKSTSIPALSGFDEGQWWVQDLSASLPAKLFKDLKDKSVIDICAAPGGKTAQLINQGAKVTALDISENRLNRLKENLNRLNFSATVICDDVQKWWKNKKGKSTKYDAVLLDAPCSATGTLRRHPDVIYHRHKDDIKRLHQIQTSILDTALDMLKDDGTLIYCVCSVLPQEGRLIIDSLVQSGKAERIPVTPDEMPSEMITKNGDLCVLPFFFNDKGGCDGFYIARLKKKKGE